MLKQDKEVKSILALPDEDIDKINEQDLTDPPPLVDWKNPPKLSDLKGDYDEAKQSHSVQVTKIRRWLDNLNIEGEAKIKAVKGNSQMQPKLIRKQAEWRYAALSEPFLSTEDVFNVRPVTFEDKDAATQNELVLSHQFNNQIDKTAFIDEFVRTLVDEGTAIVKIGWEYEDEQIQKRVPVVQFNPNPAMADLFQQLDQMQMESPSQYMVDVPEELKQAHQMVQQTGVPVEPVVIGSQVVPDIRIIKNQPTLEVCDYRNVVIDPSCGGKLDKANFIVYSFESSLSDLKKDGRYKNLEYINLTDNIVKDTEDHQSNTPHDFNFKDKARKRFVVYEYWGYWDIDGTGLTKPIIASWVNNTLIRLEENPFPDKKLPFVSVQYLPVRKSIYGEPDGELLEENQKIIGAVLRGIIDIMAKSANGQTGIRKGFLDITNRRKFDQGKDYEFNLDGDPRQAVYMHTYPEIPQSATVMLQMQNMEAESLTGVKAFSQGISQSSLGNVATSVRGALDAASKRELGILRRISQGIIDIGKKIISMNAEFLSDEETIRITNEQFVTVKREALDGLFDVRLTISTAEEDNQKAEELAYMLQTIGNNMGMDFNQIVLADIAKLRKMPDLAKKIESYQPQPDPMQEQMAQLQLQLLQAQVYSEQAKAQQLMASAQLDSVKVGTEQAKAENLKSDTDLKDLNFVEQESGVTQAREKELRQAQAQSQAELKLLDNQLQEKKESKDFLKEYLFKKMDIDGKLKTEQIKANKAQKGFTS